MTELFTPKDASKFLGVSKSFLAKARSSGSPKIPYIKIGRAVRYSIDDLNEFAMKHRYYSTNEER